MPALRLTSQEEFLFRLESIAIVPDVWLPPVADIESMRQCATMFSFGRAVIIIWLPGLVACGAPTAKEDPLNPLMIAETYARSHYPAQVPEGLERQWFVEDHGDIWIVEFGAQGSVGGGIKMAIAKHDGRVLGAEQTQ